MLAERALCGDGGWIGFNGGEGAVAAVLGDWFPCRDGSPPIKEEMDMVVPGRELKPGKSLEPTYGEAEGVWRGAGIEKADDGGPDVGDGGGMLRAAKERGTGGGGGGSRGAATKVSLDLDTRRCDE